METVTLGKLIEKPVGRDAVHIAVAPVEAVTRMNPGEHVGIQNGKASPYLRPHVGIVDPYLTSYVEVGQTFYLCLYPNTVTSLRHVWTHPEFQTKIPTKEE